MNSFKTNLYEDINYSEQKCVHTYAPNLKRFELTRLLLNGHPVARGAYDSQVTMYPWATKISHREPANGGVIKSYDSQANFW